MTLNLGKEKGTDADYILPTERRLQNVAVYGSSGSGKTRSLMLSMAVEQFQDASSGATFICGRGEESWLLDRLATKMNREVIFLHPGADKGTKDFLETEYLTGLEMQKNLIDYQCAIEEKKIVIVDFDLATYRTRGKKALIKLMYHLQRSIIRNSEESPHFIYIDDAEMVLPHIEELLLYGKNNSIGTTLFLSSYSLIEARSRELAYFLNAATNTTVVMNLLAYEDFLYFDRRFYGELHSKPFRRRNKEEVVVESIRNGIVDVTGVTISIPSQRFMADIEEEVSREKLKREVRKRPRSRGILHETTQTSNDVDSGFDVPTSKSRVFLDEEDFFATL